MLTPLACNPFAIPPAEHERHAEVAQAMLAAVQTWRELPDGYALRFATELAVTQNLVEFISRERLCCPFFNFRLEYPAAETNAVWLSLTGAEGVKAFIQSEFNLEGVPMSNVEELKSAVRERYAEIVLTPRTTAGACCTPSSAASECGCMSDDYSQLAGYVPEADYGLGCGLPTEVAYLKPGHTVLDLGSGAGNDAFVARAIVGESGRVLGVDMTAAMIAKARANASKLGFANVEFRLGEIEHLPVEANTVDVVVSNCVLNLVPDKAQAFVEVLRVLKPGGHFSISDIVVEGDLPEAIRQSMEAYAGCVAGAMQKENYLALIEAAGFVAVRVAKEKTVAVPDELAVEALGEAGAAQAKASGARLLSVTVYGEKPVQ